MQPGPATGVASFPASGRYHVMPLKVWTLHEIYRVRYEFLKVRVTNQSILKFKGSAELKCAKDVGDNAFDTTRTLSGRAGEDCSVACIGSEGENLVHFACIINEEHRAAGRTGVGAIMGSKKLKAIVVKGDARPEIARPEEFKEASKEALDKIKNPVTGEGLPTYGTAVLVNVINNAGALPISNLFLVILPLIILFCV